MKSYKRLLALTSILLLTTVVTNTAAAETYMQNAVVKSVQKVYSNISVQTPVEVCTNVNVPIYGDTNNASTADVLAGAIFGGLIGNSVGGGKGKDAATLLGAIAGADIANKKSSKKQIIGYQSQRQCNTNYTTEVIRQYDGNIVMAEYNNMQLSFKTNKFFNVGDSVSIQVSLSL